MARPPKKDDSTSLAINDIERKFRKMVDLAVKEAVRRLESGDASDVLVLKTMEIGAKALGIGGNAVPKIIEASPNLSNLADRLILLQSGSRNGVTYEAERV